MSELEARFRVRLDGMEDFSSKLKRGERDAKEFQKAVAGAFKDSAKEIAAFGIATGKSLASLALGNIGIASQAKSVLALRDAIAQLTVTAGKGADYMGGLRDQIHEVAIASNQMQGDVTDALSAFVERTGDIQTARDNLAAYAKVATATGAAVSDISLVGVELSSKLHIGKQGDAFAILAQQSKMGSIELRDLATKGPKIFAAAANAGATGETGLRQAGALAQVYAQGFGGKGSAASVATAVERTFSDIATHGKGIRALGIKTDGRDKFSVLQDIVQKTGGDETALRKIFGVIAMRGVSVLARNGFDQYNQFRDVKADPSMIDRDFALRRGTGQAALNAAQISVAASADKNLGDKFDYLAHNADKLARVFDFATSHLSVTASVLVAGLLAKNLGGNLLGYAMRGGQFGVQQVYVTGAAPGALGGGPGGAAAAGTAMGRAFSVVAAAGIGYAIGTIIDQTFGISSDVSKRLVDNKNKQIEAAADDQLSLRARGVKHYEKQGMSHGAAIRMQYEGVESAEKIFERLNKQVNQISVNIVNDRVESVESNGTRTEASLVRRGMTPGERAAP